MAEARSIASLGAASFAGASKVQLSVDNDGLHLRTEFTIPPPREAARRTVASLKRFYRTYLYALFPLNSLFVVTLVACMVGWVVQSPRDSWVRSGTVASAVWRFSLLFPWVPGTPLSIRVAILAAWVSVAGLLLLALAQRWTLNLLLRDKTYLYSARAPTLWTRVWFLLVKMLTHGKPLLYSFQSSLPHLPVPDLKETVGRYLESAKMLQNDAEFAKTEELARQFLAAEGPKLQWYLHLKSWFAPNYVTDWWEKYVYLRGRSPIAINSNYYVLDQGYEHPTTCPESRAAIVIYSFMRYKKSLEDETLPPVMAAEGVVPLCSDQFRRIWSTDRVPNRDCDELRHWDPTESRHVAVYCKGSFYKLQVYNRDGCLRAPDELESAFVDIKRDAASRTPRDAEASIPALTGDNRTKWAEARETFFSEGQNRRSLDAVESAILYVVLSDEKFGEEDWTARGKYLIAGNRGVPDVWFDKSITLVVFADGKTGLNCEHSWADAPITAHMLEVSMIVGEDRLKPYDATGHVKVNDELINRTGCARSGPADESWSRLTWSLSRDAEDTIMSSVASLRALGDDLDHVVTSHTAFGKDFVKKCKVSPDAFVQMALQLAYFRDQGRFDATYESSMTRLFLQGRTETVRPVTKESCLFVRTMENKAATPQEKLRALQAAARRHVLGYCDAMAGKGIDRHLFALYCVAVGKSVDSPFLKGALSVPWKLSTSQQPQQQTTLWDIKDPSNAKKISPGGGFGPVADDGYGVSYMVSGERLFFFHVTSRFSSKLTSSSRFVGHIFGALSDMKAVLSLAIDTPAATGTSAPQPQPFAVPPSLFTSSDSGATGAAVSGGRVLTPGSESLSDASEASANISASQRKKGAVGAARKSIDGTGGSDSAVREQ